MTAPKRLGQQHCANMDDNGAQFVCNSVPTAWQCCVGRANQKVNAKSTILKRARARDPSAGCRWLGDLFFPISQHMLLEVRRPSYAIVDGLSGGMMVEEHNNRMLVKPPRPVSRRELGEVFVHGILGHKPLPCNS